MRRCAGPRRGLRLESEPLYRRALAIFQRRFGLTHYEIAVNLNNLAAVCQAPGRGREAERLYARALAIKEALLGPAPSGRGDES